MGELSGNYDILIVGGGVFGITTAVELSKRKHKVGLINPDSIPHPLAASTDISKAVRMEYGSDQEYFRMAEICIEQWRDWNEMFGIDLYHETGFLMLCKEPIDSKKQTFEKQSYENLLQAGYAAEKLGTDQLENRFPSVNTNTYSVASFNPVGGYAESSLTVEQLVIYAKSLGVDVHLGQTATEFVVSDGRLSGVKTREGAKFDCGHAHIAAGPYTPLLLPELRPYFKATGHPVFWLRPDDPALFKSPELVVFTADISNSGWYGFPFSEKHKVVKVAKHSAGLEIHPENDVRQVTNAEVKDMRIFLANSFPTLANAPLVFTRRCLYTDTLDGHFWIDNHPEIKGLSVGTGGSGHGFKMAPLLGEMQADVVEGGSNPFSERYRWRHLVKEEATKEDARYIH